MIAGLLFQAATDIWTGSSILTDKYYTWTEDIGTRLTVFILQSLKIGSFKLHINGFWGSKLWKSPQGLFVCQLFFYNFSLSFVQKFLALSFFLVLAKKARKIWSFPRQLFFSLDEPLHFVHGPILKLFFIKTFFANKFLPIG